MGKKRKAGGRPFGHERSNDVPGGESKLRINTYEDVANSEDEFFINQDKILLEESLAQKRQRKTEEDEKFLEFSDEEILAESPHTSESEEVDEDDDDDDGKFPKQNKTESHSLHASDSEATPNREDDSDGWGTSRRDYYDADPIETEADALEEEAEARRLQQKQLQGMTEEDFGFDEVDWLEENKPSGEGVNEDERENLTLEILPLLEITDAMGPEERLNIMRTRYPEFEPLAKEFVELQAVDEDLKLAASAATTVQLHLQSKLNGDETGNADEEKRPIEAVKHGALSAYLAALCVYFALLTSDGGGQTAMSPAKLRNHPIMLTLVQCRELWRRVKDIPTPEQNGSRNGIPELLDGDHTLQQNPPVEVQNTENINNDTKPKKRIKPRKTKVQKALLKAQADAEAARLERVQKTEQDLLGLAALIPSSKPSKSSLRARARNSASPSEFGEHTSLTPHEASEKAKRKKSLRFYTSQIAQKSQKRNDAGRDAGGDNDLPYRERLRDRQARLNAEAEGRGKKKNPANGAALGGESDEEDRHIAAELREAEEEEDYYGLVSARSAAKKAQKAALADSRAADRNMLQRMDGEGESVEADGKRAISYAIEKNKGLAPRRKKDVRNPRVKKRKKYEDKKNKLSSIRKVYKGGEEKGGYGGEKTGIKKGLVRSVKL